MGIIETFILAVALSMDAFAVSVCKGLSMGKAKIGSALTVGLWFGIFQALMPLIGFFLGVQFEKYISIVDHWIAFILLAAIGANMVREAVKGEEEAGDPSVGFSAMLPLAIATSIDALASGVAMAAAGVDIIQAVVFIGITTFVLSTIGVRAGSFIGGKNSSRAEAAGGIVLIAMGLRILIQHLVEHI